METMKCTSCGETVLSTDKFCKQCGKPNEQTTEQKTETAVVAEKERKKVRLSFWLAFVLLVGGLALLGKGFQSALLLTLVGGILVVFNGIKLFKKPDNQ